MPRRVNIPGADEIFGPAPEPQSIESDTAPEANDADHAPAGIKAETAPTSGRVRHNEKMTVYLTSDELLALEQTRLQLRSELGRNIDRGRLVRAAISVALDDVDSNGLDSQVGALLSEQ